MSQRSSGSGDAEHAWPESHFWSWSTTMYARPGVADACLELQDRYGANVNLVLLACWLGATARRVDAAGWSRLHERTRVWQDTVVGRMRAVRRELRAAVDDASTSGWRRQRLLALRQGLAALELDGERLEQHELEAAVVDLAQAAPSGTATALDNLRACLAGSSFHPGSVRRLLQILFPDEVGPDDELAGPTIP